MAIASHGVVSGQPARWAIHNSVTGCTMAAGAVNQVSARITSRVTTACAATSPLRLAKNR
jgi:hypothetical protein